MQNRRNITIGNWKMVNINILIIYVTLNVLASLNQMLPFEIIAQYYYTMFATTLSETGYQRPMF